MPLRNGIQCVATNQYFPNVGDTIEFNNGVFNEQYGKYKQYVMQDDIHECVNDNDENGNGSTSNIQLDNKDNDNEENHLSSPEET